MYSITYDYTITGSASPEQEQSACQSAKCWFAPTPRTGLGPSGGLCDMGGACNGGAVMGSIQISRGTTWNEAFATFLKTYPTSGTYTLINWANSPLSTSIRWDKLCIGFATLPTTGVNVSVLAPGTVCGSVTRPTLNCTVTMPNLIDLGTVPVGTDSASATAYGGVVCLTKASVTAALLANPRIDGHEVEININWIPIGNEAVLIGSDTIVPINLTATIRGSLRNAGSYSSDAILQISYH